jgi:hypothetical protein
MNGIALMPSVWIGQRSFSLALATVEVLGEGLGDGVAAGCPLDEQPAASNRRSNTAAPRIRPSYVKFDIG